MNEPITTGEFPASSGALPMEGGYDSVLALLQAGGPVVAILMALSVLALAITFLKLWQFATVKIASRQFIDEALAHWRAGRTGAALEALDRSPNPIARVLAVAIRGQGKGINENIVREEAARVASAELEHLRGNLRGLELIGGLSPLLGLLGTVLGMIEAFQQLAAAGSRVDPSVLSGGIWEAWLTTAVGLAVAIPAITVLHGLERAIERLHHGMEDALTRVFTREMTEPPERTDAVAPHGLPVTEQS